ncbi:MAG: NPCBM/NEW2 domain-containing protein [Planctomycetaceae bacterium]|nr:NPCBM/NEW2 domain-containing protein [Planctomycetaceae bacterium]
MRTKSTPIIFIMATMAIVACLTSCFAKAETYYIDTLDLSVTDCGWRTTQSRKSVEGNPLSIAGRKFDRGVGHHSPGVIAVRVPQTQGTFSAWVGIDDEVGKQGHAEFLVYGNKELLWRSGFMVGGQEAKYCQVEFRNIETLYLVVDEGPEGYAHDHADWGDAKIDIPTGGRVFTVRANASRHGLDVMDELGSEWVSLEQQIRTRMRPNVIAEALRPESTILPTDRDPLDVVLRRTRALLENLRQMENGPDLQQELAALDDLDKKNTETALSDAALRKDLFAEATALRRTIALENPLLDFENILFIKRHFNPEPEMEGNHMCDQFFGFHGRPGGGLFVLENAFSDNPTVKNLLAGSVVEEGRYEGARLDSTWAFLSPELSFDAQTILFSATDASQPRHSYTWNENNCYHLFEVNMDGTNLVQMTDGPWNDICACYMPNGRIALISERRGGYGRCHGRPVPSYTLHSMNYDGSDIAMLSPHETNEWFPSIDHDGMIVYTRWDYVDRGFNQAHHPWITTPDGRDSRVIQGNFPVQQSNRPHFEISIRAVPDSRKLTATAACHHGQYFGSLILIDPTIEDDDFMSQVRRITPDQLFPESENAAHRDPANYGQPYPLSEDYYLCVYDPFSSSAAGPSNNYGIYLLDSFGNRTLLYRDPNISCQSPIPVRTREVPPVIPHKLLVAKPLQPGETFVPCDPETLPKTALVGVMNVYNSARNIPNDTHITHLRIVQLLPKTNYYAHNPAIGYGDQKGARMILGTVPVEPDGSALFQLPVNVPVYFQALDDQGVAVQSMRSATYVKPGEELMCLGCHEGRYRSPVPQPSVPLAFSREPSEIAPGPDGTKPLSYVRLIQPIWDKHCVDCHQKESVAGRNAPGVAGRDAPVNAIDLSDGGGQGHFSPSYSNLRDHVFFFDNADWTTSKTIPGEFGAQASKLYHLLKDCHYDVQLTKDEMDSIVLWLDNNADFYGAYDDIPEQRIGQIVWPKLE